VCEHLATQYKWTVVDSQTIIRHLPKGTEWEVVDVQGGNLKQLMLVPIRQFVQVPEWVDLLERRFKRLLCLDEPECRLIWVVSREMV
jgi:hypothetical protein